MKRTIFAALVTLALAGEVAPTRAAVDVRSIMCFFEHEEPAGMNKICYYNCAGSTVAITIRAAKLCPLSINR